MIDLDYSSENLLSILGALFDIAGAALLARALAFVRAKTIVRQSSSAYGGVAPSLVKMFAEQQVDASFGLALLAFGFSIQGAAGYGWKSTNWTVFGSAVAFLALVVVSYFALRRRLTEWRFKRACRTFAKADGSPIWTAREIDQIWERER